MLLPHFLDKKVQKFLERKGYVRLRAEDGLALARRRRLLDSQRIDLVLDVGANSGQFAMQLRELGYTGKIHSFEPMKNAWGELTRRMAGDSSWEGTQAALGEEAAEKILNISANSVSSSFFEMLPRHLSNAPNSGYVGDELVRIVRLDDEFPRVSHGKSNIWLKIDTQGYELNVLKGAALTLNRCRVVQVELSLVPLYADQSTFLDLCTYMNKYDFDLIGFEAGFQEKESGALLQVDGIFRNRELCSSTSIVP